MQPVFIHPMEQLRLMLFALADLQIQGQILPAPLLQYGQRTVATDRRPGSWEPGRYSVPGKMPSYAIASFADRRGTENAMNVSTVLSWCSFDRV